MKKIYLLPNLVTTANLVCGFLSMVHAFKGEFIKASWFIIFAAICDLLDGRIARLARATSPFGVQYDSLADLTSFGIAPAILLFSYVLKDVSRFGVSIAAFYAICAALRLARFNVSVDENAPQPPRKRIRKGYFQGLPSPASAGLVVTTVLVQSEFSLFPDEAMKPFLILLDLVLAIFMISNIPFPSFKEVNWRSRGRAWVLLIPVGVILFLIQAPELTLFTIGYTYLVLGSIWAGYLSFIRDRKQGAEIEVRS